MYLLKHFLLIACVFAISVVGSTAKEKTRANPWDEAFDFDGDKHKDTVLVSFSDGAHCCYRISIKLSSQSHPVSFPFWIDGGYVGGLDLSNPDNFFISDFDHDGKPEIYMHISQYNGKSYPILKEWQQKYDFKSNNIIIDFKGNRFVIYDFK
ncbi:MAG: hypothetical protein P8166_15775 [Candidatus Thiodiazotropha sp.]